MKLRKVFKEAARQVRKNDVNALITVDDDGYMVYFSNADDFCEDMTGSHEEIRIGLDIDLDEDDLDAIQDILDNYDSQDYGRSGRKDEGETLSGAGDEVSDGEFERTVRKKMMGILDKLERGIDEANKKARG